MENNVTKAMSIGDVLRIDQGTAKIFMAHGLHCLGCPHATSESIEEAGVVHGIQVDKLVDDLNTYLQNGEGN